MDIIKHTLDIKKILKILPHRYPLLLIDRVIKLKVFKYLTAIKNCTYNEFGFQGHFLNNPIFPGVLIVESMAQAAGILIYESTGKLNINVLYHFVGIDQTRFKKTVTPGDQILIEVFLIKLNKNILQFKTTALVDNHIVCRSRIIFAKKLF
ncbi:3-hydroxyacyl-ACP dehydratase FabZ [Buchnera aphidicola]|uniref:3-hydroxyacyl-[acyl-carrier-protein] dehydratase FabZ n=1 Tax=Buchnera aphidicola (Lipaphis pseudobrassicae) TaxID=1258543 RepID=A0A4D6Y786_9GAMM|nr:3-hydroxyacyl-ACP dehydratase FabZ [Buchnera aphidicola]QCI22108.1 3-hydroxyacyl-ACP dehydratase FabZ [Buchnera aphidicola (Lipaphis pseudobrassicae)]